MRQNLLLLRATLDNLNYYRKMGLFNKIKPSEEEKAEKEKKKKEWDDRTDHLINEGFTSIMMNAMYKMSVLNQSIDIILYYPDHKRLIEPKKPSDMFLSRQATCSILGFDDDQYRVFVDKKKFGVKILYYSIEAIHVFTYLGYKLDSVDNIKKTLENNSRIIEIYNSILHTNECNWNDMISYMEQNPFNEKRLNAEIAAKKKEDEIAAKQKAEELAVVTKQILDQFNKMQPGDVLFKGIRRQIVYNEDQIKLESYDASAIQGLINAQGQIPDQQFFIEDVRGITVHEGRNVVLNAFSGQSDHKKLADAKTFIRFELKGENVSSFDPEMHPYTVVIDGANISSAKDFEIWFNSKIKEVRQSNKNNVSSSSSSADELLKFSELLEKGLVSQEEFEAQKKKILGI